MDKVNRMPVIFFGHGSPMNALENNSYTEMLKNIGNAIARPKVILVISAHWETNGTFVTAMENPRTIHDFYGFPRELFEFQYPAPGDNNLAKEVIDLVKDFDIELDYKWGFDHGSWSVLTHVYPDANIPIVQLSLDKSLSFEEHYRIGQSLRSLREKGVLIVGSGNIVHNLREVSWKMENEGHPWAVKFDSWVKQELQSRNYAELINNPLSTTEGKLSIPTVDHYLPLLYIIGASDSDDQFKFIYEGFQIGSMSMTSFLLV